MYLKFESLKVQPRNYYYTYALWYTKKFDFIDTNLKILLASFGKEN